MSRAITRSSRSTRTAFASKSSSGSPERPPSKLPGCGSRDGRPTTRKRVAKPEGRGEAEIHFLTIEQPEAALAALAHDAPGALERSLYLTAAMSGLRQGELPALRWKDVDWLAGKLKVRRAYVRGDFGTTKSRRGFRAVPLADRVGAEGKHERHRLPVAVV